MTTTEDNIIICLECGAGHVRGEKYSTICKECEKKAAYLRSRNVEELPSFVFPMWRIDGISYSTERAYTITVQKFADFE